MCVCVCVCVGGGVCPTPSKKSFRSVPSIKGLKMLLSSDVELKKNAVHMGAHLSTGVRFGVFINHILF